MSAESLVGGQKTLLAHLAWELTLRDLFLELAPGGHSPQALVDGRFSDLLSKIAHRALTATLAKPMSKLR